MEPLAALGLAAAVMQFVSFASHLVCKTKEIQASASGQTAEAVTLETVYSQLKDLSSRFETSSKHDLQSWSAKGAADPAIEALSKICKDDCRRLLEVVGKLKCGSGSSRKWNTFKVALRTTWSGDEIAELEKRLHHTQTTLTLHICARSSDWCNVFEVQLNQLRRESIRLNAQQSERLAQIANILEGLGQQIAANSRSPTAALMPSDLASLEDQMKNLSLCQEAAAKQHMILRTLGFESRPMRHASIHDAHRNTFEWVFRKRDQQSRGLPSTQGELNRGDLLTWLEREGGHFWVSGKPGSGKSTLMKFVADHPKTLASLRRWASPKRPVLASHYFWSAGTPMQKSQQGLLQTLLHELLRQLPDLTEKVCVERWPKTIDELEFEPWSVPELQKALQRIAVQDIAVKFCFFIDGLDEFDGDHVEICSLLQELTRSPYVKLCISSRARNVFVDAFGQNSAFKLYMHELTQNDIRIYTDQRLKEDRHWNRLAAEVSNTGWLIDEISKRADGVFLWVFLVTQELRNGLTEYDSFDDLRRRLDRIPDNLEAFFKQILDSVESFYHQKMATTMQICLLAKKPAPLSVYGFHDMEYENSCYALQLPVQAVSESQATSKNMQMARRLNARSRGLLEVNPRNQSVSFIHRSVMDFLRTADMTNYLERKAPQNFNPSLCLLRAYIAFIKSTVFVPGSISILRLVINSSGQKGWYYLLVELLDIALSHAKDLNWTAEANKLLDELDSCIPQMQNKGHVEIIVDGKPEKPWLLFRVLSVMEGMTGYLRYRLPREPNYFSGLKMPILSWAIDDADFFNSSEISQLIELLQCLLENGSSPNSTYHGDDEECSTPWKDLVELVREIFGDDYDLKSKPEINPTLIEDLMALMFEHGADPTIWPAAFEAWNAGKVQTSTKKRMSEPGDYNERMSKKPNAGQADLQMGDHLYYTSS